MNPDYTQAAWELGSAVFSVLNIFAIRRSKSIAGIHWAPTAFYTTWGLYNLWFYTTLHLPVAWWAGIAITCTNATWLGHVAYYETRRRLLVRAFVKYLIVCANAGNQVG